MSAFKDDADARRYLVRVIFTRELGREPSVQDQTDFTNAMVANGADAVLAVVRDSAEAQTFRAKRGW